MARHSDGGRAAVCLQGFLVLGCLAFVQAFGEAEKFLVVSSPSISTIAYARLPPEGAAAPEGTVLRNLVSHGLKYPQGIAIDDYRRYLYVADPSLGKLVRYKLSVLSGGTVLSVGRQETVASPVEVRAVAVDGLGNVWFTDEPGSRVLRLTAAMVAHGGLTPEVVFDGIAQVSSPGGIALDNYFVYWLNKAKGLQAGTMIKARQTPATGALTDAAAAGRPGSPALLQEMSFNATEVDSVAGYHVRSLAKNSDKCYGMCLALGNAFFTDESKNLYGVPRTAVARGEVQTISSNLVEPRGCAYDGHSTVYVADKGSHAILQLAANMEHLRPERTLSKVAELQGAFGVAVFTTLD